MKKALLKKLAAVVLTSVMVFQLAACGGDGNTDSAAPADDSAELSESSEAKAGDSEAAKSSDSGSGELQTVGFLSAAWSDDYCKRLSDAIVEHGPEYGFEVNALNGAPDGNADVAKYMEGIDALLAKNPDAMIIQPLFTIPDYCMKFNEVTPLTFVNIAPEISETSKDLKYWYAGCYDINIGAQLAEEMAKGLKDGAKICQLNLTYGQTNTAQRDQGFKDWMAENRPDVEILETNYVEKIDAQNAQTIFEDWIQKYGVGGFDGVATQGGALTQGVIECMKTYDLDTSNFIVVGISASTTDWIKDGYEYCELYQDPHAEAKAALDVMRHQMDGTTDELVPLEGEENVVAVPMTPITIDNVDEFDF